jgi:hypothetical protein
MIFFHSFNQAGVIFLFHQLNADERGTAFPAVFLGIFKEANVVCRAEHVVEKLAQGARALRETDDEIVL